jgi:hypothetical protein
MRECRTYGSVRGAPGNGRFYRDHRLVLKEGARGGEHDGHDGTGALTGRWFRPACVSLQLHDRELEITLGFFYSLSLLFTGLTGYCSAMFCLERRLMWIMARGDDPNSPDHIA